jgi:hypothetical protein
VQDPALPNVPPATLELKFTVPVGDDAPVSLVSVMVAVQVAVEPATIEDGTHDTAVNVGRAIVKVAAFDVPPPGVGLNTVTDALPIVATSEAEIGALSDVELPNVVVRLEPSQRMTAPGTKPVPVTVKVKPAEPAAALLGFSAVMAGVGLLTVNAALSPAASAFPVVRVARTITPASATEYVTPLTVTWLVPMAMVPVSVPPSVPVPA